ncbi:MAG TPA: tetratricopeptide repeat protein [bacterium]|nr:tetratricopeptide repeat protein [bacterium]
MPESKLFKLTLALLLCAAAGASGTVRLAFADARAEAMAKGPALEAGFYSIGTNPAMLVDLPAMQFGFTHKQLPAPNATSEIVGAALPLGKYGTIAAGFGTVLVGSVERYDPGNRYIDSYLYHDDRLSAGYGVGFTRWLGVGATLNYDRHVNPTGAGGSYGGATGDAGFFLRTPEIGGGPLTLAATAQNLIAVERETDSSGKYREPLTVDAGASWARYFGNHRLTIAASAPAQEPYGAGVNGEVLISSKFAARGGVLGYRPETGDVSVWPSGGAGFMTDLLSFDYCYTRRGLGDYHFLSVSVNPGRESWTAEQRRRKIEGWLAEGLAFFDAGNYERAAERFAAVLNRDPDNAVALENLNKSDYYLRLDEGIAYLREQDWRSARGAFENALALRPEDFLATEYLERANQLEREELTRIAEENRVAQKFEEALAAKNRRDYRGAIKICGEILAAYPDNEKAGVLLDESRSLLIASRPQPGPGEEPEPVEPEPEIRKPTIPPEAVTRYRQGNAYLSKGSFGQAIIILGDVVTEYPTYGTARVKLVEALLYQGLEFYSKGQVSSALKAWRQAAALDPGNAKAKRYIERAEAEIR